MKTTDLNSSTISITVYPEAEQGSGAFDGGKITEIKPIPFPQERGGSRRIGPLLSGRWGGDGLEEPQVVAARDFAVLKTGADAELTLCTDEDLRVVNVMTPLRVDYPLQF